MWRDRNRRIHISADEARGAEIMLRPARLWLFLGGLALAVAFAVVVAVLSVG